MPKPKRRKEMNKYELGVILRADVAEDVYRAELERVKGLIERFGGTIERVDDWGRRKTSYPIQKQNEGMYTFINYEAPGDTVREVESRLRLMESVLRFLTIAREEGDVNTPPPAKVVPITGTPEPTPAPAEPAAEPVTEAPAEPAAEPVTEAPPETAAETPPESEPAPTEEAPKNE
jgi:small subunit ribosomal protein S6